MRTVYKMCNLPRGLSPSRNWLFSLHLWLKPAGAIVSARQMSRFCEWGCGESRSSNNCWSPKSTGPALYWMSSNAQYSVKTTRRGQLCAEWAAIHNTTLKHLIIPARTWNMLELIVVILTSNSGLLALVSDSIQSIILHLSLPNC